MRATKLGWVVASAVLDGLEITQFTYFQQPITLDGEHDDQGILLPSGGPSFAGAQITTEHGVVDVYVTHLAREKDASDEVRARDVPQDPLWFTPVCQACCHDRGIVADSQRSVVYCQHAAAPQGGPQSHRGGLTVRQFSGHTWGQVECFCGAHIKIYSTGRNPEFGAKLIHKFFQRHRDHQAGKP